jgi:hypothetical protein
LGILDEPQCKGLVLKVSREVFKEPDHPVIIIAKRGIGHFIPDKKFNYIPPDRRPDGMQIEFVPGFDDDNQSYFS